MTKTPNKTPDWLLERIALGELPEDQLKAARAQLESEPDGLQRLQAIEASNQAMLQDYPVRSVVAGIRERQQQTASPRRANALWSRLAIASPIAAAAALVLWLGLPASSPSSNPDLEITHSKGLQSYLLIYRKGPENKSEQRLLDGDMAQQGDLLQLVFQLRSEKKSPRYAAIFSLDGRGQWTRHLPAAQEQRTDAVQIKSQQEIPLAQSYQLDDAPDFECFYLASAAKSFALPALLKVMKQDISVRQARSKTPDPLQLNEQKIDLAHICLSKTNKQ